MDLFNSFDDLFNSPEEVLRGNIAAQLSEVDRHLQFEEMMTLDADEAKSFFCALIGSASQRSAETLSNVRKLIQKLIDGDVDPKKFLAQLQKELQPKHYPFLIDFLKKNLPGVRRALVCREMTIEGILPPPVTLSARDPHHTSNWLSPYKHQSYPND